jgi:hypothetical protein
VSKLHGPKNGVVVLSNYLIKDSVQGLRISMESPQSCNQTTYPSLEIGDGVTISAHLCSAKKYMETVSGRCHGITSAAAESRIPKANATVELSDLSSATTSASNWTQPIMHGLLIGSAIKFVCLQQFETNEHCNNKSENNMILEHL